MGDLLDRVAEAICARYVDPYVRRIARDGLPRLHAKQVHDPVWGTISLGPLEVALLDSPLMQRLRHLRQLGVAHWVYPGADHSRFEHTLGVLHQTQELVSAINRAGMTRYQAVVVSEDDLQMLRVAALMHDVGHPVLSHVSEYALRLDPASLLQIQREKKAVGEKVTVSELVAAKVVRSNSFEAMLAAIAGEHAKAGLQAGAWMGSPVAFADRVARTILGQNVSSTVPLLHELVSGPYDADKLDYMVRDPRAAGIPVTIDISRLVQKLTVLRLNSRELPPAIARMVPAGTREAFLFGFPWSGLSVVDDLLLGRIMLYSKIYRHPKVAALEAMVQALLDQIGELVGAARTVDFIYGILDDQLVLADEAELVTRLALGPGDTADAPRRRALEIAVDMLRRFRERELFVRAFAFFPGQPEREDDPVAETYDKILKWIDSAAGRKELVEGVVAEARAMMDLLGEPRDSFRFANADRLVVLRHLQPPTQKELRHAWIFPTGGVPRTVDKTSINKDAWSSSFVSASAKAYIFTPKELAQLAFLATEAVISTRFKVNVPEWMMEETKQSVASLQDLKLKLRRQGYYRDKPRLIRPLWPRLRMSDVENAVDAFATRFGTVQETVVEALADEAAIEPQHSLRERTLAWLDQFDEPEHVDCALVLLEKARLVDRNDVVAAVRRFVEANKEFASASVISLNKGNDSSQIVQYFAADAGRDLVFYGSLEEAASANRPAPVLIVDDFCGSGNQWTNLIGSMFGNVALKREELNEQRPLALEPEREFLRANKVAFVFTAGWTAGRDAIRDAAREVGLDVEVSVLLDEDHLPFARAVLEASDARAHAESFLAKASEIGSELLRINEPDWPDEKVEQRCLGYGNKGMLLFFPYNAPSQTLTCMWAGGRVDGEEWMPLIRRRKKVTSA